MKRIALAPFAAALLAAAPFAAAGEPIPHLKEAITVGAEIVTIGDLFDNAGEHAGIALFRAPDPGRTGSVSAELVARSAEAAGMTEFDRGAVETVTVTRAGRLISTDELIEPLRAALAEDLSTTPDLVEIAFDVPPEPAYAAAAQEVRLARLARSPSGARFDAVIQIGEGNAARHVRLSGTATALAEVVTALRPLDRGEIVAPADVAVMRMPARRVLAGAASSLDDVVGLAARRAIRPGGPLNRTDFAPPNLVERGQTVTIVYRGPGLLLSTRGKALENGARGAAIAVANLSSNRILTATVTDRGSVEVSSGAADKLAMGATQ